IAANYATLATRLGLLDARFRDVTPRLEGVTLLASHPAYNYVAQRYGWDVHNFDLDPEAALTDENLSEITAELSEGDTTRLMLWESEPSVETAETLLRDHRITSVVFSPCETLPAWAKENGQDYLAVMSGNLDRLKAALD
ncbi:MAG: zinc ABC transporter substrate-binding protein, partial [Phycisphaerales bacterium]|nr:zinc ABC transporter substrate-binding protein [Phycisphaerales bacterium]